MDYLEEKRPPGSELTPVKNLPPSLTRIDINYTINQKKKKESQSMNDLYFCKKKKKDREGSERSIMNTFYLLFWGKVIFMLILVSSTNFV